MYCTRCGQQIEEGARYCSYCGEKIYKEEYTYDQSPIYSKSISIAIILSIVTFGIYGLYWLYKAGERINEFQLERGIISDNYRSLVYLILGILGWNIIAWAFIQNDLNKYAYDS